MVSIIPFSTLGKVCKRSLPAAVEFRVQAMVLMHGYSSRASYLQLTPATGYGDHQPLLRMQVQVQVIHASSLHVQTMAFWLLSFRAGINSAPRTNTILKWLCCTFLGQLDFLPSCMLRYQPLGTASVLCDRLELRIPSEKRSFRDLEPGPTSPAQQVRPTADWSRLDRRASRVAEIADRKKAPAQGRGLELGSRH
jgi:hypothetical protein